MEPLLKTLKAQLINLNSQIKNIKLLLTSVVILIFISETQYAVVKHVAKKNKWNLIT